VCGCVWVLVETRGKHDREQPIHGDGKETHQALTRGGGGTFVSYTARRMCCFRGGTPELTLTLSHSQLGRLWSLFCGERATQKLRPSDLLYHMLVFCPAQTRRFPRISWEGAPKICPPPYGRIWLANTALSLECMVERVDCDFSFAPSSVARSIGASRLRCTHFVLVRWTVGVSVCLVS
jgi:hypothetical protein